MTNPGNRTRHLQKRMKKSAGKPQELSKLQNDYEFFEPHPICFEEYRVEHEAAANAINQRHNRLAHEINMALQKQYRKKMRRSTAAADELEKIKTAITANARKLADRDAFENASVKNKEKKYAATDCNEEGELWRNILRSCVENSYAWRALEVYRATSKLGDLEVRFRKWKAEHGSGRGRG